jgi:phospholipase/carboxylesterase
MKSFLDCVEINPDKKPQSCVIWLHGLGADGHDFEPIVPELRLPPDLAVRFVFPHAPERAVTINFGMKMRAWFDITDTEDIGRVKLDEFGVSVNQVRDLIQREITSGLPAERIVLAGFSQGGAIALHTGLFYEKRLAGILALSTFLPTAETVESKAPSANKTTPIMMAHGQFDPLVPMAKGVAARNLLNRLGYDLEWNDYPMQHAVCPDEIDAVGAWLKDLLARD